MEGAPNVTTGCSASAVTTPRASSIRLTSTARLPSSECPVSLDLRHHLLVDALGRLVDMPGAPAPPVPSNSVGSNRRLACDDASESEPWMPRHRVRESASSQKNHSHSYDNGDRR